MSALISKVVLDLVSILRAETFDLNPPTDSVNVTGTGDVILAIFDGHASMVHVSHDDLGFFLATIRLFSSHEPSDASLAATSVIKVDDDQPSLFQALVAAAVLSSQPFIQ